MLPRSCSPLLAGALSLFNSVYTTRLASRLEEERRAKTKAELVAELMARYRDPLMQAAFDLQSRIYNVVEQGFLQTHYCNGTDSTKEYARENTLYVLADYLGWVEILRRQCGSSISATRLPTGRGPSAWSPSASRCSAPSSRRGFGSSTASSARSARS